MSMKLTEEQIDTLKKGEPVRMPAPQLGDDVILIRASAFEELDEILRDEREQQAIREFAARQAARVARENPY